MAKPHVFSKGDEVRILGWQKHWPDGTAEIASINRDKTEVVLSRPLLGRKVWKMSELRAPFK